MLFSKWTGYHVKRKSIEQISYACGNDGRNGWTGEEASFKSYAEIRNAQKIYFVQMIKKPQRIL